MFKEIIILAVGNSIDCSINYYIYYVGNKNANKAFAYFENPDDLTKEEFDEMKNSDDLNCDKCFNSITELSKYINKNSVLVKEERTCFNKG